METLVEFVSLIPTTGVLLGASVSLACWLALLFWLIRIAVNPVEILSRPVKLLDGKNGEEGRHGRGPAPLLPQKPEFHSIQVEGLTWEYCPRLQRVWCSKGLREFLGLEADVETISLICIKGRIHPKDVERAQSIISNLRESGVSEGGVFEVTRNDGAYQSLECEIFVGPDDGDNAGLIYGRATVAEARERTDCKEEDSASRWELLLDASEDGFWEWPRMDEDAQWWSDGFYRLLGLEPDEIEPGFKAFMRCVHPSDRRCFDEGLKQTVLSMTRFQIEARLRLKNGSYRWFSVVFVCEHRRGSEMARITGSIRDVQSQREAQIERDDTNEMFRSVIERTTVGLALIDGSGFVLHANPALSRMLGVRADQIKGVEWRSIVHSHDWSKFESIYRKIFGGEADYLQIENRYRAARNGSFDALTGLSRLSHSFGNGARVIAHIQDVTALKQAERDANDANMCKSQFLAHMSHEIRTPLNGVMGMTQLVLSTELSSEQQDFLVTAQESSEQLLNVINDILDLSKIEAGKLEIAENNFRLRDAMVSMSAPLSLRAHEKGLEFVIDIDPDVPDEFFGDWARVQQILINLIGNAIKFTETGEVVIRIIRDEPSSEITEDALVAGETEEGSDSAHTVIRFCVADAGMGVPQDQHQRIFGAFNQVDPSLSRGYQGTGLGLAISAELVRLMGGRIEVSSEPDQGSQFEFSIGLRAIDHSDMGMPWDTCHDLSDLSVLLVDESISARAAHARLLRNWKVAVTSVVDLKSAECELEGSRDESSFDLILMNSSLQMEARRLGLIGSGAREAKGADVALMIASPNRAEEVTRCREAGFGDYFLKPIDPRRLLVLMERIGGIEPKIAVETEMSPQLVKPESGCRFLVAEDSPISRKVVVNLLKRQGHEVVTAANGMEAVIAVGRSEFDAVFMDINMPDMDGLQATNLIREREQGEARHVWIVALTAQALQGDRGRCLAAGMDDYVTKPIRWPELWNAIQRIPEHDSGKSQSDSVCPRVEEGVSAPFDHDVLGSRRLVELAIEEVLRGRNRIGESIVNESAGDLRDSSHRLKGVLLQCQMTEVAELAERLESIGDKGRLASATELYADLVKGLIRFDRVLQERRQKLIQEKAVLEQV
jgi:two-component system, sensor histidine kinase and response regulator